MFAAGEFEERQMKRTIIWMSAWKGFMKATIYVPLRHMDGVFALPISEDTKAHFRATKNVGQSKPCIFEVRNQKVLKDLNTVMQFKIRTKQTRCPRAWVRVSTLRASISNSPTLRSRGSLASVFARSICRARYIAVACRTRRNA